MSEPQAPGIPAGLLEQLAATEHRRWADWQRYMHGRGHQDPLTLKVTFDWDWIERWERQIATPYAELSEAEKASDREQVMRYWPLIMEFVAEWLSNHEATLGLTLARLWREEVGDVE